MPAQGLLPGVAGAEEFPWIERDIMTTVTREEVTVNYTLVDTLEKLGSMVLILCNAQSMAHDTETSGLTPALGARIVGHACATFSGPLEISTWYVPIRHVGDHQDVPGLDPKVVSEAMTKILTATGSCFWAHAKFDLLHNAADGITCTRDVHDVLISANIADENEQNFQLKRLAGEYVCTDAKTEEKTLTKWMQKDARGLKMRYKKRAKVDAADVNNLGEPTYLERFGYSRTPVRLCGRYACRDVLYTLWLGSVHYAEIPRRWESLYRREHLTMQCLLGMQTVGLPVNTAMIRTNHEKTGQMILHWLGVCREMTGLPDFVGTDEELRTWWYEKLRLKVPKQTDTGKASVDAEAREILKCKYPQYVAVFEAAGALAQAGKYHTTYSGNFLKFIAADGRIRPSYNQLDRKERGVPRTGRLSSNDPNIQNVAWKPLELPDGTKLAIREYFQVPEGYIRAYIDFSQIELRVLAWFCQDKNLIRAYQEGLDIHQMTAEELVIDRKIAKQVNFGNTYGMTEMGLANRMPGYFEDPEGTRERAKVVLENFFKTYPAIKKFERGMANEMRRNANSFVNPFGRPRRIEWISSHQDWQRRRASRQMMSSIISGTAADLMKECMIRTDPIVRARNDGSAMVQSIHDELVFDLALKPGWSDTLGQLMDVMTDWPMFSEAGPDGIGQGVPIEVSCELTRTTWADKKEIFRDGQTFSWEP